MTTPAHAPSRDRHRRHRRTAATHPAVPSRVDVRTPASDGGSSVRGDRACSRGRRCSRAVCAALVVIVAAKSRRRVARRRTEPRRGRHRAARGRKHSTSSATTASTRRPEHAARDRGSACPLRRRRRRDRRSDARPRRRAQRGLLRPRPHPTPTTSTSVGARSTRSTTRSTAALGPLSTGSGAASTRARCATRASAGAGGVVDRRAQLRRRTTDGPRRTARTSASTSAAMRSTATKRASWPWRSASRIWPSSRHAQTRVAVGDEPQTGEVLAGGDELADGAAGPGERDAGVEQRPHHPQRHEVTERVAARRADSGSARRRARERSQ